MSTLKERCLLVVICLFSEEICYCNFLESVTSKRTIRKIVCVKTRKAYGEVETYFHAFLNSALRGKDIGVLSASSSGHFTSWEHSPVPSEVRLGGQQSAA